MPAHPGRPGPGEVSEDGSDAGWRRASVPASTALSTVATPTSTHAHQLCLPSVARVIATPTTAAKTGVKDNQELRAAVRYIQENWQRKYGFVQVA
jgi:hypothetical protein